MKKMTKEWVKDIDFHDLITVLRTRTRKKIPFVFTNGGTDYVAREDLFTVKTSFNVTEKENELSFVMLPKIYDLEVDNLGDGKRINDETRTNNFIFQYANLMRVISYIPDDILKNVKDKRMLAFGYAEKETKQEILKYITDKYIRAFDIYSDCDEASFDAEEELTIHKHYRNSVPFLFDRVEVIKAEKVDGDIYLTLEDNKTVVFSGAEIIEEETDILNTVIRAIELYKMQNGYEIHFLLLKRDENFIANYYYVTYTFKDMKLKK